MAYDFTGLKILGVGKALDLNAGTGVDLTAISILNSTKYIPTHVLAINPSASVALATLGLYTGAAASGVTVVTPVLLAGLTGTGKLQSMTALFTDILTATTLIPRLTIASGGAGTIDLVLLGVDLSKV